MTSFVVIFGYWLKNLLSCDVPKGYPAMLAARYFICPISTGELMLPNWRQNLTMSCYFIRLNSLCLLGNQPLSSCLSFISFSIFKNMTSKCLIGHVIFWSHSTDRERRNMFNLSTFLDAIDLHLRASVDVPSGIQLLCMILWLPWSIGLCVDHSIWSGFLVSSDKLYI